MNSIFANMDILENILNNITLWYIGQYGLLLVDRRWLLLIRNKSFRDKTMVKYNRNNPYITIYSNKLNIIGDYNVCIYSNNKYHPLCIDCQYIYIYSKGSLKTYSTIYSNNEENDVMIKVSQRKVINNSLVKTNPILYYKYYMIIPNTYLLNSNKEFYNIELVDMVHQDYLDEYLSAFCPQ